MTTDPAAIAAKLTPAQRDGLLRKPCPSWYDGPIAAFPGHKHTAQALWKRGLILGHGSTRYTDAYAVTPLGLRVRAVLEARGNG